MKRVDFTTIYSMCGDPSSHILEALESTPAGDKVEVRYRSDDEAVKEALKLIAESGVARIVEERCDDNICVTILEKSGG